MAQKVMPMAVPLSNPSPTNESEKIAEDCPAILVGDPNGALGF